MLFINNGRVMGNLILSGLLDRYTKVKFVSVESGIGWLPFLLEAIDYEYQHWFGFQQNSLTPQLITVGVAYHFPPGKPRRR